MGMLKAAAGTVMVFKDQHVLKGMEETFPQYADKVASFSGQSAGMLVSSLINRLD